MSNTTKGRAPGDVESIRARRAAITCGRWVAGEGAVVEAATKTPVARYVAPADAAFIAHAPEDIDTLLADRDAWRDALQHVACRLGGTGAGSPDDVRLACDDLAAQDDDLIAAGVDYQRDRDELRALVRGHFAAEAALDELTSQRNRLYDRTPSHTPETREVGRAHAAAVVRAEKALAALRAKVTP